MGVTRVTADDVAEAAARLEGADIVTRTPVDYSGSLGEMPDAEVYLKFEHLQRAGSFKPRGAYNELVQLVDDPSVEPSSPRARATTRRGSRSQRRPSASTRPS